MSYKIDEILTMLDQILMKLDHIEKILDFDDEAAPESVDQAFDKLFDKKVDKPKLSIVKSDNNNVVDLDKND